MKAKYFIPVALIALALFFALGSAGGYDAGTLSLGGVLACSAGSVAVIWASFKAIDKIERGEAGENARKREL